MANPLPPDTVCGYTVVRSPSPGTYIALADGGRQVLLKPLDPDCLLHGQLHPSIKERLARVRELALKSAANLHGVERDSVPGDRKTVGRIAGVYLVWEFIDGKTLEEHAAYLSAGQITSMMREVVLSVGALHQVGIVHGAIHARNVIVDSAGRPRLTHISPLLFHDPAVDEAAVGSTLARLIEGRSDIDPRLAELLRQPMSLRELASRLVAVETVVDDSAALDAEDRRRRRQMLLAACGVAVLGVIVAVVVFVYALWARGPI